MGEYNLLQIVWISYNPQMNEKEIYKHELDRLLANTPTSTIIKIGKLQWVCMYRECKKEDLKAEKYKVAISKVTECLLCV